VWTTVYAMCRQYNRRACTNCSTHPGLAHITTELLRRELQRRQEEVAKPECGSKGAGGNKQYNTGSHVFALGLILALSTAGAYQLDSVAAGRTNRGQHAPSPLSSGDSPTSQYRRGSYSSRDTSEPAFS
jgi:hypothetical protein